jgi:hypothetical protein
MWEDQGNGQIAVAASAAHPPSSSGLSVNVTAADGGGLKFWGATADHSDTFRDVLVYGNISRNNVGWTWVSVKRTVGTGGGRGCSLFGQEPRSRAELVVPAGSRDGEVDFLSEATGTTRLLSH